MYQDELMRMKTIITHMRWILLRIKNVMKIKTKQNEKVEFPNK